MRLETVLAKTKLEPRPYQGRVVTKVTQMFCGEYRNGANHLENAAKSVIIESPTGSGKTSMGMLAARYMQERHEALVGWIAMRRNLLGQAEEENRTHEIGVRADYISMFCGDLRAQYPHLFKDARGGRKLLLIVDECQHDGAASMQDIHNQLDPDCVLGLSATPYRTDGVKLCFEKVVKDAGIHALIQDGYLSRYDHYTIPDWTPEAVADFYAREPERWGSSLFFFLTRHECETWRERMLSHGLAVDVVTGSTDRDSQIADLKAGRVCALANMAVLTEGFNYPDLKTVWVRDSGHGPTVQMGGRVFRLPNDKSIKFKQVVQSRGTDWPMMKTALPHRSYVWQQDQWLSLTVNPQMLDLSQEITLTMAEMQVTIPNYLKERVGRNGRARPRRF